MHRDIKPQNILIKVQANNFSSAVAKLADFGMAKLIPQSNTDSTEEFGNQHTEHAGTAHYRHQVTRNGRYAPFTDMYSFGKVMEILRNNRLAKIFTKQSKQLGDYELLEKQLIQYDYQYGLGEITALQTAQRLENLLPKENRNSFPQPEIGVISEEFVNKIKIKDEGKSVVYSIDATNAHEDVNLAEKEAGSIYLETFVWLPEDARTNNNAKGKLNKTSYQKGLLC